MKLSDMSDRVSERSDQLDSRLAEQPLEERRAQTVGIPSDAVVTDRLRPGDPGAVEQQHRGWHSPDEVFVLPIWVPGTAGHRDPHAADASARGC